jgi:hypothetical protein
MKKQKIRKRPVYGELKHRPGDISTTEKGKLYFSKRELTMFSDGFRQALEYKVDSTTIKNIVEICNTIPTIKFVDSNLFESLSDSLMCNFKYANLHLIRTLINESDLFVLMFAKVLIYDDYGGEGAFLRLTNRKGIIYKFAYILNNRIQKDMLKILSHPILIEEPNHFYDFIEYLKFFRLDKNFKEVLNKVHKLIQYNN